MPKTATGLSQRAQVIAAILERLDEFSDPLNGPSSMAGSGDRVPLMPGTYTASVREVERLYKQLRSEDRSLHWHLAEWYVRPTVKVAVLPKLTRRHGKTVQVLNADRTPVTTRSLITRRNPNARQETANRGVTWMAERWALVHEPFFPSLDAKAA